MLSACQPIFMSQLPSLALRMEPPSLVVSETGENVSEADENISETGENIKKEKKSLWQLAESGDLDSVKISLNAGVEVFV